MARTRHSVFLFDGGGAVVSIAVTAAILFAFQRWLGMPSHAIERLLVIAVGFCAYSLSCWRLRAPIKPWLPIVMSANVAYCVLVAFEVARNVSTLTTLGLVYFAGEVVVILGVVAFEWRVLRASAAVPTPRGPSP